MSRIAERLGSRSNVKIYKVLVETFNGPSSYPTGGFVLNSTILRSLERATALPGMLGLIGEVVTGSVSGNAFTLRVYTGTQASGIQQIPNTTNLSMIAFSVLIEGF
jgi:hypothetical protein